MRDYDYQSKGTVELLNPDSFPELTESSKMNGHSFETDFQLQTSSDGRVWINIRGICLLRFKPSINGGYMIEEEKRNGMLWKELK